MPDAGKADILILDRVECRFGGVVALNNVSLAVKEGSITGVIGPNGAGKTTLFNVISGAVVPTSGRVYFAGHDVTGWPPNRLARKGIARTFQNIRLFASLTVREHVELSLYLRERVPHWWKPTGPSLRQRAEIDQLLGALSLNAVANRLAPTLPYAMQRRLEIARALALHPQLLLLDEPAAGMNPAETRELAEILASIAKSGVTLLLVEHDMGLVMNLCHHVIVLNFGEIIAAGPPRDVQREPAVLEAYLGRGWAEYAQN